MDTQSIIKALRDRARKFTSLDTPQDGDLGDMALDIGTGFIPGVGTAQSARDLERARREGDKLGMGLAGIGMVPFVGGVTKGISALRKGAKYPQAEALETARKNAVKMLGLPENNTALDREKALGFDTDVFHGSKQTEIRGFDTARSGQNTGNAFDDYVFSTSNSDNAAGYALNWDTFKQLEKSSPEVQAGERAVSETLKKIATAFGEGKHEDVDRLRETLESMRLPRQKLYEDFINQRIISEDATIYPLVARSNDFLPHEANGGNWMRANRPGIEASKAAGKPGAVIKNVRDNAGGYTGLSDVYATNQPQILRSRFAAFDPARVNENDLLGGADPRLLGMIAAGTATGLTVNALRNKKKEEEKTE